MSALLESHSTSKRKFRKVTKQTKLAHLRMNTIVNVELRGLDYPYENGEGLHIFLRDGSVVEVCTASECSDTSCFEELLERKIENGLSLRKGELNGPFSSLIGKHLLHFGDEEKVVQFEERDDLSSRYEKITKCTLALEEGKFVFMENFSTNGFYGLSKSVRFSFDEDVLKKHILDSPNRAARITMVVGLPRSGKTTHCNELLASHQQQPQESKEQQQECVVFDDFLSCFEKREWMQAWMRGAHIVVNDPRLCREEQLNKIIHFVREELRCEPHQLKMVFLPNTPDRCIERAMAAEEPRKVEDIRELSKAYSALLEKMTCEDFGGFLGSGETVVMM